MKVKFYSSPFAGQLEILFYEERPNGQRFICEPIELKMKLYDQAEKIRPTLIIPDWDSREMMKDLAREISEHGIKNPNESKIEGMLESTKYHLEDLRKIIFK